MPPIAETLDHRLTGRAALPQEPGIVLVFSGTKPILAAMPLGKALRIGRATNEGGFSFDDARMSREHCEVSREKGKWCVRDLGSRNGTFVDGAPAGPPSEASEIVLRMGETVALAVENVVPYLALEGLRVSDGRVSGPALRASFAQIETIARSKENLLVRGETGAGKELAAAHFHASGDHARGPFVSVNCAAIPEGVAERLLFGAKKGAYSGAVADADGYVVSADKGVLFLDELGELDLDVQAKLLRLLETKEVMPLGASSSRKVDVRFVLATHRELRAAVTKGTFRADLFYRIGQAEVILPALRTRREEIPWLAAMELARIAPQSVLSAEIVETMMLRAWPGNVRELFGAVRHAARTASIEGVTKLRPDHVAADAGRALSEEEEREPEASKPTRDHAVTREELEAALRDQPSASAAAKHLGIHRSHLYRLVKQFGL